MKLFFGVLILANVGLFMWASWYRDTSSPVSFILRPQVMPEKLKFLSEPDVKRIPRTAEVSSTLAIANKNPVPQDANGCFRIGPFLARDSAESTGAKLVKKGLGFELTTEIREVTTYRVTLGPLPSKQAAERQQQKLIRLGIRDHALLQDEGEKNVISLGVFAVQQNAENRLRQLDAEKIKATLQPITVSHPRYWLMLPEQARDGRIGTVPLSELVREPWSEEAALSSYLCNPSTVSTGTVVGR